MTRRAWSMGRIRVVFVAIALLVMFATGGAILWARAEMRASLPHLDGARPLGGLTAPVTVARDALGVPTIRGRSRQDVARATGFVHAQDRFFQMDLARRRAAGELSALVGRAALEADREVRIHRFRPLAQHALTLMGATDRALLEAYTAGVNAGLAALDSAPFEYAVLREDPLRWRPEDTLLVVLSMFITLQDADGSYEQTLGTMHDVLPAEFFDFLASIGTEWDTPIVGERFAVPPIPGPDVYNLRERRRGKPRPDAEQRREMSSLPPARGLERWRVEDADQAALGSNSIAVAGSLTSGGTALIANDMHLTVRVPNTWYRAVLEWPDTGGELHHLAGVTLPGAPALVVGSNTHIAWAFTNTYADWGDIVTLEIDPADPTRYRTPHGWRTMERHDERIEISGEEDHREVVMWTIWGPVLEPDHRGRQRAYRWVAHAADRLAGAMTPLEDARSIEEAFRAANGVGTPGQNVLVADRSGRIGWSIYGSIPRRVAMDGRLPSSWADGSRGWSGWLEPGEYPRIADPSDGRLWTANARVVDGEMLAKLGDGSYEVGSRARIIRDRLVRRAQFNERDLLNIQLDAGADFLARWRELLLQTLTPAAVSGHAQRAQAREILQHRWDGWASPDSAAYRLTRMFRDDVSEEVITFLLAECYEQDRRFRHTTLRRREGPIWKVVSERPMHLLDPSYSSWDALLLASLDRVIESLEAEGTLEQRVWSDYNITVYRHPLSPALPFIGRLLDMPRHPLPGDLFTPRVHWGSVAASQRMVVSPGREEQGIFHMPTGQSGHPLSPFYSNSHDAWVRGEPTSFLPGAAVHTLTLTPN